MLLYDYSQESRHFRLLASSFWNSGCNKDVIYYVIIEEIPWILSFHRENCHPANIRCILRTAMVSLKMSDPIIMYSTFAFHAIFNQRQVLLYSTEVPQCSCLAASHKSVRSIYETFHRVFIRRWWMKNQHRKKTVQYRDLSQSHPWREFIQFSLILSSVIKSSSSVLEFYEYTALKTRLTIFSAKNSEKYRSTSM